MRTVPFLCRDIGRVGGSDDDGLGDALRRVGVQILDSSRRQYVHEARPDRAADRLVERPIGGLEPRRAEVDDRRLHSVRRDPLDGADRRGVVGARGAGARQDAKRVNTYRARDAERPSRQDARDMSPVSAIGRRRRIAVIGVGDGRLIARSRGEIADPVHPSVEFAMAPADAGVDDVGMNARAIAGRREAAIKRKGALVDAIESPRSSAGRLLQHPGEQETDDQQAQVTCGGVSRHYFGRSIRTMSEFSRERSNTIAFPSGVMSKVPKAP